MFASRERDVRSVVVTRAALRLTVRGDPARIVVLDAAARPLLELLCARQDHRDSASWLLAHGADSAALGFKWDCVGPTPLEIARAAGHRSIVELLESAGAGR